MKLSRGLRREKTNVGSKTTVTFNAPGVYNPPYGKTAVRVGGRGASGNATTGGNYAYTNPSNAGYTEYVPGSGGNYWYTNPASGGNYAGTNPASFKWGETDISYNWPVYGSPGGPNAPTNNFIIGGPYPSVLPSYYPGYGLPYYDAVVQITSYYTGNGYAVIYRYNNTPTYATPAPGTGPYAYGMASVNYTTLAYYPGGAYYNPVTPGNAVYTPYYPAYSYYVPGTPGNAVYNPVYPGTGGGNNVIAGVYFQGGDADNLAPVTPMTTTTIQYTGEGINITVPTGGYVTIDNI